MTDIEQPLFRSVEHALAFAFRHDQGNIGRPLMNRMADGPRRVGRGLVGLDASLQAGFILAAVFDLGEFPFAVAAARYLPHQIECNCGASCCHGYRPSPDWRRAIETVTTRASAIIPHRAIMQPVRRAVVLRHFGEKVSLKDIAERCHIDRDTASQHAKAITDFLRTQESTMRYEVYEKLALGEVIETT